MTSLLNLVLRMSMIFGSSSGSTGNKTCSKAAFAKGGAWVNYRSAKQ